MGHHINKETGFFESDKFVLPPDRVAVSFTSPRAWPALFALARGYEEFDLEFAADIRERLASIGAVDAGSP